MPAGRGITSGVDAACAIRPPRCATGPRLVSQSKRAVVFERSQVEAGAFHINYNMVHCMEGSEKVSVHPLMREESASTVQLDSDTAPPAEGKRPAVPKQKPMPTARPPHRRPPQNSTVSGARRNAKSGTNGNGNVTSAEPSSFSSTSQNVTDHEQIPFAVKTQLEVWLAAFSEEARNHRSKTICYETLLTRVREVSNDQEQPTLFSLVTALILLTQFVPQLGPYGDLMQGIIAELASAVYLLPSKGVGFTVALDAYAKKAFFDAYREVRQLFDMHQARAKRYRSLLRLEANVLQGSVDRWSWQCMNMAFRGWRMVIRDKRKQEERSSAFFHRWKLRTFVPRALRGWARIAKVRLILAAELDDSEEGGNAKLRQLYELQQQYKAQRISAEGEFERLTLLEKKTAVQLSALRAREIDVSGHVDDAQVGRSLVAHSWAATAHLMFGDVHEIAVVKGGGHQQLKVALEEMLTSSSSSQQRRRSTVIKKAPVQDKDSEFPSHTADDSTQNGLIMSRQQSRGAMSDTAADGGSKHAGFNLSDNAASLRKRASNNSSRMSTAQIIPVLLKFAPYLRQFLPQQPSSTTSNRGAMLDAQNGGTRENTATAGIGSSRDDTADIVVLLLGRMYRALGASTSQFPVRVTDLIQQDQGTLRSIVQEVWWVLCGGHCSLFLDEKCLGPPKPFETPRPKHRLASLPPQSPATSGGGRKFSTPSPSSQTPEPPSVSPPATAVTPSSAVPPLLLSNTSGLTNTTMLTYDQRPPFESSVLFPSRRPHGNVDDVEAAWMVRDTERGMDRLQPLEELHRASNENWARIAQEGDARSVHLLSQAIMNAFLLFHNQRPPAGLIEHAVKTFVRPHDWSKILAAFPEPHVIQHSMDLVEYTQLVSTITGNPMKSVLQWILSSAEFTPIAKLFVAASSEDVASVLNMHRDAMKSLMRQCSTMVSVSNTAANNISSSLSESMRARQQRPPKKVLLVQREKFISAMMSRMSSATMVTREGLDEVFSQTLVIRHGLLRKTDGALPPISRVAATPIGGDEVEHLDEEGFIVLLLYCANFHNPDPFLTSAARMGHFLESIAGGPNSS